ncbi:uncharacterized protein BO72DRAFT_494525 [Aspergillus fijiensis CBS 313.89]|uniref:C2H2-type domain-containing protein n=1 Tax=Aspergillus fijiensis CBS 313.89 TaxID=1448319 RepID=A0A8G1RTG5_9EURO|nr:uncharacterized protein BO72DRAFT_494525 [Aspergillus fijiensis CBS 313.89]RAK79175.1 hypothetical protein BO72DRAFT_494525 [Aspergillus fijiensis CBS 313.89]
MRLRPPKRYSQEPLGTSLITAIRKTFKLCLEQNHLMRETWAVVRMSDFNLWVDGWGAAAATETLLDARLQALPESDQKCLQDNLHQLKDALSQGLFVERSEKSMRKVDFLVSQLAKDAVAIRRREAQPRIQRADQTFDPRRQQSLRDYFKCMMLLLRPTDSAVSEPESPPTVPTDWVCVIPNDNVIKLKMTPLQERLIEANLRRRYRFLRAQRESDNPASSTTSGPESTAGLPDSIAADSQKTGQYPSPPKAEGDFKCPCCCQPLPDIVATDTEKWRQHLLKDIQPFTCIAKGCPTPGIIYSTRSDWERHVEMDHRRNRWICPICRDMDTATDNVEVLLAHMWQRHPDAITPEDAVHVIHAGEIPSYGLTCCPLPLCKETGSLDSSELVNHVLRHTHDFALQALPLLTDPDYVLSWLNDVSEQGPPSSTPPALDLRTWDETAEEPAQESSGAWDYFDRNPYFADDSSSRPFPAPLSKRSEHISDGEEAIDHQVEGC